MCLTGREHAGWRNLELPIPVPTFSFEINYLDSKKPCQSFSTTWSQPDLYSSNQATYVGVQPWRLFMNFQLPHSREIGTG